MATPRRPVPNIAVGSPPPTHGRHGEVATYSPRLMRIQPFEQDTLATSHTTARPVPRSTVVKRPSLGEMPFDSTTPTATLLDTLSFHSHIQENHSHTGNSYSIRSQSSPAPSPAPPSEFLASLRAKTLLDYDFMRAFSLAKRRPVVERNLSRMSARSVYSMRMAQLELEAHGQRLQRSLVVSVATEKEKTKVKADGDGDGDGDEIRSPSGTVAVACSSNSEQSARPGMRRLYMARSPLHPSTHAGNGDQEESGDTASTCFPTLWRPSASSDDPPKAILRLKYRQPQCLPSARDEPTDTTPRRVKRDHKLSKATAAGPLLTDGLSEFDLRKCHATSIVTAQHGYLQDQDLQKLLAETGYDRAELYALWARFKALCAIAESPQGIDKDTFRRGIPQLSVEDRFFIDRVFDILDADGSGILEWQEFVEALSALEKGDVAQRVGFLFRVYDLNGDGSSIHRNEVMQFFLTSLLIDTTDELVDVARHFVGKIFDAVGCGDKDTMSIGDALQYMRDHPSADIYSLFGRTMVTKQRVNTNLNVSQWRDEPTSGLQQQQPKKSRKPPRSKAEGTVG